MIPIDKDNTDFCEVTEMDMTEILALYKAAIGSPGCVWTEEYPSREILLEDVRHGDLYGIKNADGKWIAAIAKDRDEEVANLPLWSGENEPAAELSRLVVAEAYKNQGIARILLRQMMKKCKEKGMTGVHFLVAESNMQARRSYQALEFQLVGETDMYGHHYLCYEKRL